MYLLKKQLVKRNYHKETLKITIDMAWPAIVESFFVAFAGLIDSLMVSSLGSYAVAAVGLTTQPKLFYCDRSYHLKYCIRVFCQCNHRLLRFYGRHTQ